jgi:hypothetical protein
VPPTVAHAYQGAVGGVSALLYLIAAMAAFVFLESRDKARTADPRAPLSRRTKAAGAVLVISLVGGVTAPWWVPHDERPVPGAVASSPR